MLEQYHRYISDVESGKAVVCLYIKQAVARQQADLKRAAKKSFPYFFDETEAQRWLSFISILRHTSGEWKGKQFLVQDFQAFRWACLFGWQRKDGKGRRFRRAYIEVARKQGKTEEAAAVALGGLIIDGEETAQIFSAATTRQQAKIVYSAARIMARQLREDSEIMRDSIRLMTHRIIHLPSDSFFEALSSEADTLDGLGPHVAIIDEFHAHGTSDVMDAILTGMGKSPQPIAYIITTAGFDIESPCFNLRRSAIDILSGAKVDETLFTVIYTLDEEDDWNDEKTWIKANPQIGVTPTLEFMSAQYQKAVNEGGQSEVQFKTKNLNIWTSSSKTWIPDEIWQKNPKEIDYKALEGRVCYGGIDFASVADFTALCLVFPPEDEDGEFVLLPFFWIPDEVAKIRARDFPDVKRWIDAGLVTVTPGNVTDYAFLEDEMKRLRGIYRMLSVGYDPHNAWQTVSRLEADDFNMSKYSQAVVNMSPPAKEFERLARQFRLNHGDNPVLRWMLSNVMPDYKYNDNLRLSKMTKNQKIDGIIAAVIGIGEYLSNPQPLVYSDSDLFLI